MSTDGVDEYGEKVGIPYLSALIENIKRGFSENVVKL